jgi:uncharacterized protein (DUF2249 family)
MSPVPVGSATDPLVLDVRPLFARGQSPCDAIEEAVAALSHGQALVLIAPFEPIPLYTKLGNQGFAHETTRAADGSWRVEFRRGAGPVSGSTPCACSGDF